MALKANLQVEISVLMPAFNAGMFISESIESILSQSFNDWELIVVDDGSTDDTKNIIEQYAASDSRIRPLFLEHRGISKALNAGLVECRSDIVARMDADDHAHPDRLAVQYQYLEEHLDIGVVGAHVDVFPVEDAGEGIRHYVDWTNSLVDHDMISLMRFVDAPMIHPSVCFRKELAEVYAGYADGDFPEDYELWLRWLSKGVRFGKVSQVLLDWRDHSGKLTRSHERYRENALWGIKGTYFDEWFRTQGLDGRSVLCWGSGRKSRSRLVHFETLSANDTFEAFVDIDPRKIGQFIHGIPVVAPSDISRFSNPFIVVMVGSRGARKQIIAYLEDIGRVNGSDFVVIA